MIEPAEPQQPTHRFRLLLVDSEDLIHWGFRSVLSRESWVEQLASAHNTTEALELARRYQPHVAVIDTELAGESAAELFEDLLAEAPATRVLLLSGERMSPRSAAELGAAGVVPKTWKARDIANAALSVALGMTVLVDDEEAPDLLSEREMGVLRMLARGATNREIADRLGLSEHTIKDHVSAIYRKMDVRNRAEAIVRAQRRGIVA